MKLKTTTPKALLSLITLPLLMAGCNSASNLPEQTEPVPDNGDIQTKVEKNKHGWALIWNDEFDGTDIDMSKWNHEVNCWGGGNNEQQCYTANNTNSFVSNGLLTIRALKQPSTGSSVPEDWDGYDETKTTLPYSSARLRTKNQGDWKYGRFEIRAKLPQGQGTWPAIWMLPTDFVYGGWAASGEIDIMEAVNLHTTYTDSDAVNIVEAQQMVTSEGTQAISAEGISKPENRVHATLHYGKNWPKNVSSGVAYDFGDQNINPADDFHTYAIEWQQGEIRWYVDDVHYATQTQSGWWTQYNDQNGQIKTGPDDAPFNQNFHLLLNLAIGGGWAANVNHKGIDPTLDSADMLVDYVRVYQCEQDPKTGKGCASNVSKNAIHNPGVSAPSINIETLDLNGATLSITQGAALGNSFNLNGWDSSDNDSRSVTDEGLEIQIVAAGNAYIEALSGPLNMSNFAQGELVFDLQISQFNAQGLVVKMDSGWPNVAPITIPPSELPQTGKWKTFHLNVADFIASSADFDITQVVNPVVFEPVNGKNIHLKVKNIRFLK
ncbi:family 16 glycosylhydrolase [Vibrio sp. MA40-2]|uniref:family 16 glycosylhydrolase n=1 Tax=Vibrio sp. MA40-2 TaxID=3391828 RepID=UPI0039A73F09